VRRHNACRIYRFTEPAFFLTGAGLVLFTKGRFSMIENSDKNEIKQGFMSLQEAGTLLGISPDAIRLHKAGTETLTHIRMGSKIVLIRAEVMAFIESKIANARQDSPATKRQQARGKLLLGIGAGRFDVKQRAREIREELQRGRVK
jgi:hypothetical protein